MRTSWSVMAMLAGLAAQVGCDAGSSTAPQAKEAVSVTVVNRTLSAGEKSPDIHLSTVSGRLSIRVTRQALCGTLVNAAIDREGRTIALVSHVSASPLGDCVSIPANDVVDYTVEVGGLVPGSYRVNVFEGLGDGAPTFLGSASVIL